MDFRHLTQKKTKMWKAVDKNNYETDIRYYKHTVDLNKIFMLPQFYAKVCDQIPQTSHSWTALYNYNYLNKNIVVYSALRTSFEKILTFVIPGMRWGLGGIMMTTTIL